MNEDTGADDTDTEVALANVDVMEAVADAGPQTQVNVLVGAGRKMVSVEVAPTMQPVSVAVADSSLVVVVPAAKELGNPVTAA